MEPIKVRPIQIPYVSPWDEVKKGDMLKQDSEILSKIKFKKDTARDVYDNKIYYLNMIGKKKNYQKMVNKSTFASKASIIDTSDENNKQYMFLDAN